MHMTGGVLEVYARHSQRPTMRDDCADRSIQRSDAAPIVDCV
jgi:hypothetical protein